MKPCPGSCKPSCSSSFLVQRILGTGKVQRSCRYPLPLDTIPCGAEPPFTLQSVCVHGNPCWQKLPCNRYGAIRLQVTVPLLVTLCDKCGRVFHLPSSLTEEMYLHTQCCEQDAWHTTVSVAAYVRLCNGCSCCSCECEPTLDVMIEGYLTEPYVMGASCPVPCPEQKPWYPQPRR